MGIGERERRILKRTPHPSGTLWCGVLKKQCLTNVFLHKGVLLNPSFSLCVSVFFLACSSDKTSIENTEADVSTDFDADGFHSSEDCDDANENINPAAIETCDGVDNNCDGVVDENVTIVIYEDGDGDGYGNATATLDACEVLPGYASNGTDCNDAESI